MRAHGERESWRRFRAALGPAQRHGSQLVAGIEAAGLRGCGGAGFPTAVKWRAVADARGPRVVVANGEEGEPLSVKDRWLLRVRPHLVLDGLLLAQEAVGADRAIVYLADEKAEATMRTALIERHDASQVEVVRVAHDYVAGEETAAVRAIDAGPAKPTAKPPRPFESGVGGLPTLVQNVETLAHAAMIARDLGSPSLLVTISGACAHPGLYELPPATTIARALECAGAELTHVKGVLMGGYFAGLLNRRALELPLDYDVLRAEGSGLGCGAMLVLSSAQCPVAATAAVLRYFAAASSQQCGACINGTMAMAGAGVRLEAGAAEDEDIERLQRWSVSLRGRGACALLDGAAQVAGSLLREFREETAAHVSAPGSCPQCATVDHAAVIAPDALEGMLADWSSKCCEKGGVHESPG
jgi:NADH:ubiquinone oxidoreductase subunit F (NADH-binding)